MQELGVTAVSDGEGGQGRWLGKVYAPGYLVSFTGGRGCASVCLGGLKSVHLCWSGMLKAA
jgi:hypothetical protein